MSSLSKMATELNAEFHHEIIKEFTGLNHQAKSCSGSLTKFMLSGRESFYATLYYFSKADRINFWDFGFDICVKKATHCFGYDWKFLDVLLKVALPSVNHLCIYECPTNDIGNEIMDKVVLENDLKHLILFVDLPKRYKCFFMNGCKFETVYSQHRYAENPSLFEMLLIPSECHNIVITSFGDFVNQLSRRALPFKYLNVKKLVFEGSCFANANSNDQYLFMQLFFFSFINLECIEIECNSFCLLSTIFNVFMHKNVLENKKFDGNILITILERDDGYSKWNFALNGRIFKEKEVVSDSDSDDSSSSEEEENDVDDDNSSVSTANELSDMDDDNLLLADV